MSKFLIVILVLIFSFVLSHTVIGEEQKESLSLEKKDYQMEKKDYQVQIFTVLILVTLAFILG